VHDRPGRRAVFNALGHSVSSLEHPNHRTLIRRSMAWLLGEPDHVVKEIA
jgi:type 1 glutamine amidotransferase